MEHPENCIYGYNFYSNILDLSISFNDHTNPEIAYNKILETIMHITGADAGIMHAATGNQEFNLLYTLNLPGTIKDMFTTFPLKTATAVLESDGPVFFDFDTLKETDHDFLNLETVENNYTAFATLKIGNKPDNILVTVLWKEKRQGISEEEMKYLNLLTGYLNKVYHQKKVRTQKDIAIAESGITTWEYDIENTTTNHDIPLQGFPDLMDALYTSGIPVHSVLSDIYPDDVARVDIELAKSINTGNNYELEYRVGNDAANIRWVKTKGRVETDSQGKPVYISGSNVDITEFKESEEELIESRDNNKFLLDIADAIRYVADPAEVQQIVANMVGNFLQVSLCYYGTYTGNNWIVEKEYTSPEAKISAVGNYPEDIFPQIKEAFLNNVPSCAIICTKTND